MPVTRCKFVDAARAMKIYALHEKKTLHEDDYRGVVTRRETQNLSCIQRARQMLARDNFQVCKLLSISAQKFHFLASIWAWKITLLMVAKKWFRGERRMKNGLLTPLMLFLSWCCTVKPSQPSIAVKLRHDGFLLCPLPSLYYWPRKEEKVEDLWSSMLLLPPSKLQLGYFTHLSWCASWPDRWRYCRVLLSLTADQYGNQKHDGSLTI